jgi:hypothetical protein
MSLLEVEYMPLLEAGLYKFSYTSLYEIYVLNLLYWFVGIS